MIPSGLFSSVSVSPIKHGAVISTEFATSFDLVARHFLGIAMRLLDVAMWMLIVAMRLLGVALLCESVRIFFLNCVDIVHEP